LPPAPPTRRRQRVVSQQSREYAHNDRHLLQGTEPAPHLGRGYFSDVGRGNDAGGANGEATQDPKDGQRPDVPGQAGPDTADEEEDRCNLHHGDAPVMVRERPGEPRAHG